jgi:threonine/homoserine/homoserine lactone efflux protein
VLVVADASAQRQLLEFLLGYAAILCTPGPNLLAIGSVAAVQGLRGAVPLCFGAALGAGTLSVFVLILAGTIAGEGAWSGVARLIGAALLLWVARSILRPERPADAATLEQASMLAPFGAGFCTAAANPLTAAFFAAWSLDPLKTHREALLLMPALVVALALLVFLPVAGLLAMPACRLAAQAWQRPIRRAAAAVLVLIAVFAIR